jgi:hypothetical protein
MQPLQVPGSHRHSGLPSSVCGLANVSGEPIASALTKWTFNAFRPFTGDNFRKFPSCVLRYARPDQLAYHCLCITLRDGEANACIRPGAGDIGEMAMYRLVKDLRYRLRRFNRGGS